MGMGSDCRASGSAGGGAGETQGGGGGGDNGGENLEDKDGTSWNHLPSVW